MILGACGASSAGPREAAVPLVIAHRGASYDAPEHTIAAYDLAVALRVDYIEQDLHRTSDGVLLVLHDATLDRTTRGAPGSCTGPVRTNTLAQIKACDAGSWFNAANPSRARAQYALERPVALTEVLDRFGANTRYYIELKDPDLYPGIEADLIALLDSRGLLLPVASVHPRVLIQSFSEESLKRVRQLAPSAHLVRLLSDTSSAGVREKLNGVQGYAKGIGVPRGSVDRALIEAAHAACLVVHPYTVDDPAEMRALIDVGVDGIFTNRPDLLQGIVAGRSVRRPVC
ncbi:MAG: glycerophosphodiester phosphodiesterase [Gemmatimonadota bacterium]|nr:glycerophosphodiester phosphodiesterase [Gemmatimonadota bacterium]